jgi:hypothetical protein
MPIYVKRQSYPCDKPWRPIGLWDVEAPTFSRQSTLRWRWGCQPYAPAVLYRQEDSWCSFLFEAESTPGPTGSTENTNDLIRNRTPDLPGCSMMPQPTTLQRAPLIYVINIKIYFKAELRTVVICSVIYYHLLYTCIYNTFMLAVYLIW